MFEGSLLRQVTFLQVVCWHTRASQYWAAALQVGPFFRLPYAGIVSGHLKFKMAQTLNVELGALRARIQIA